MMKLTNDSNDNICNTGNRNKGIIIMIRALLGKDM